MAPKAKPRPWMRAALVATRGDDRLLLARRKSELVFGGLWEPPSIDAQDLPDQLNLPDLPNLQDVQDAEDAGAANALGDASRLVALTGVKATAPERAGEVTHILSHRKMTISVYRTTLQTDRARLPRGHEEYDAIELVDRSAAMSRGMSTLAQKVLRACGIEVKRR